MTKRDAFLEAAILERSGLRVRDIMQVAPGVFGEFLQEGAVILHADEWADRAADILGRGHCKEILVDEAGKIIGTVSPGDVSRAYLSWVRCHL